MSHPLSGPPPCTPPAPVAVTTPMGSAIPHLQRAGESVPPSGWGAFGWSSCCDQVSASKTRAGAPQSVRPASLPVSPDSAYSKHEG